LGAQTPDAASGEAAASGSRPPDDPATPAPGAKGDLAQWEKSLIEAALRDAAGNQTKAAQQLGITRDTLRYRLKKFGIQG
jgi:DNA-binding NtrC family response regulator